MSGDERLTETVRVRVTASEKAELEAAAKAVDRKPSAVARRAIRSELDRMRRAASKAA